MKTCSKCGKKYKNFYIACPTCDLNKKNYNSHSESSGDGKAAIDEDNVEPKQLCLILAHTVAGLSLMFSLMICNAGSDRGLGGYGYAIVGGYLGLWGFWLTLFLLFVALVKREGPGWAYLTCLIFPAINYYLFTS
ncbi:MAG: hypothetical protein IBX47_06415 [Desulfuromonadales bacterium]|nr:hypothetical protein [Desulfuromonadales bacterium]